MSEERSFDYKRREIFSAALELFAARGFTDSPQLERPSAMIASESTNALCH